MIVQYSIFLRGTIGGTNYKILFINYIKTKKLNPFTELSYLFII